MEQTTTWLCPVCERVLDSKDLIIDGYFDEILKQTPEDVEDVIVEADGEWHTSDNKYASTTWKASHPVAVPIPIIKPVSQPVSRSLSKVDVNGKAKTRQEVYILDSDDEDEGQVKQELSPSMASTSQSYDRGTAPPRIPEPDAVIDLTADTDDEEPAPPKQNGKRKAPEHEPASATSPSEQIWKKSRLDLPVASVHNARGEYGTTQPTATSYSAGPVLPSRHPYPEPRPSNHGYTLPSIDVPYPAHWS
ncbi:hypothetical protein H0H87_002231 [Tephrocybe sp. NHM501043]|nr:hypothetical protein H0H87_002231 [Tephrocybe sp. NHM501043]